MESVKVKAKSKKKSKRTQKRQEARVEDVRNEIDSEISISGSVASEVSASSSSYNDPEVKPEPSTSQVSVEDLSIEESPNKEISLPLPRMHSVEPQILDQVNTTDADKTMEKKLTAEDDLTFSNESAVEKCAEPSESDVNAPCHDAHLDLSNQVQIIELESDETSEVAPSTAVANKCEVIPDKNLVSNAAVLFHEDRSMVMPSAPCEENSSVVQSLTALESNENTVDCSIPTENLSRLYPDIQHEAETTDYMLPYTESQLVYIYHNQILDSNEEFVDDFIEAQHGLESHEFYQLLISYRQARSNFNCAKLSLETISEDYKRARDCCWSFHEEEISKQDKCGDGKTVKGSCVFRISNLNGESVHQVINCLKCNRDILNGSFTLHNFEVEATYKRIDSYIYDLLTSVPEFMNQTFNGPVTCHGTNVHNPDVIHAVAVLKSCISVLFIFQRRQITDFKFIQDTRAWLNALVGLLLRFASFSDHLFILNHILRCPAGASKWAGCFIQPPPPPTFSLHMSLYQSVFGSNELDLCITCLANMLLPIRSRDTFLQNMLPSSHSMEVHSEKSIKEQPWTLLDSEGEEDNDPVNSCMKWQENDLVAFLSQIPFSEIFRHMLLIDSSSGIDKYDVKRGGEQNMLKLIAFSTILVRIMREGLKIYSDAKYHQFNKRLCGIIRDCVQFLADHLQNMRIVIDRSHNPLMIRISVEFNQLFLRAVSSIYSSHGSGSWQFLAELPFCSVSVDTLWRVLRMLHQVDDDEFYDPNDFHWHKKFLDPNSRLEFDEKLSKLLVLDAFHLMNTFTSMAFSRNIMDKEFIEDVSFQIFQIAFLSTHTRDSCSKEGLNHLSLIVTKHQFVISLLLEQAKNNLSHLGKMAVYLFSDIPLHHWKATENDFATLIKLIEETEVSSLENCLARTILSKLNWSFGDDGKTLFFDWSLQCRIALVIVKHCEKIESSRKHSGIISEIMNEVSEVASAINTRLDPEQAFLVWSWRMLLRLRLHVCDLSTSRHRLDEIELAKSSRDVYNSPALQQLLYGVNRRHPVACYTALALTNLGHRKSDICTEGFKLLRVLVEHHLYTPTLRILSCVLPLFYESSDYLECDTFVSIISTIVFADETYWKMAKKIMANVTYFEVTKQMITPAFPGPILKQLSSMIRYDFDLIAKNSPQSARNLVKLWFRVLARIPDWNRDEKVQFVLDAIIQQVFKDISCMTSMKALFQCLFQQIKQKSSGMGASLFSFMSTQHPSLIPSASLPMCPWYAYTVLDAEEEEAINMKLWINLLQELDSNPNLSVDAALKRVSNKIGVQIPTKSLPIYRWAQQAMDTRKDHPLFTIFWLRFFVLYLQRVPSKTDSLNRKSVGQTFFKSFSDLSFLKSMKKCLTESVDHFRAESLNKSSTSGDASSEALKSEPTISSKTDLLHHKISMLLYVFLLWLEEPRLHEASLYLPSLPEQYNAQLLQIIFDGDKKICMEYVDLKSFSTELEANHWQEIIDPSDLNLSSASSRTNDDDSIETVLGVKLEVKGVQML